MIRKDRGTPQEDAIHIAKVAPFVFLVGFSLLHLMGLFPNFKQDQADQHPLRYDRATKQEDEGK